MAQLIYGDPMSDAVEAAEETLKSGGVVVIPTDTVYGIVALPSSRGAIERIFEIKKRPQGLHLPVLISGLAEVGLVSDDRRPAVFALAAEFWPGPLTLVLPLARDEISHIGTDDGTVGVRCPDHALARAVVSRVGPVAATSANLHSQAVAETGVEAAAKLPDVDLVIDAGLCDDGVASTVVNLTGAKPIILREGLIKPETIHEAWDNGRNYL